MSATIPKTLIFQVLLIMLLNLRGCVLVVASNLGLCFLLESQDRLELSIIGSFPFHEEKLWDLRCELYRLR